MPFSIFRPPVYVPDETSTACRPLLFAAAIPAASVRLGALFVPSPPSLPATETNTDDAALRSIPSQFASTKARSGRSAVGHAAADVDAASSPAVAGAGADVVAGCAVALAVAVPPA